MLDLSWKLEFVSALTIYGLSLTVPQWWIFRRHMKRASLWILFSMTGWMLAGVAWLNFGVNSGVESIAYGIVPGLCLVWLVHSPRTNEGWLTRRCSQPPSAAAERHDVRTPPGSGEQAD
jgi:hypothetical protein